MGADEKRDSRIISSTRSDSPSIEGEDGSGTYSVLKPDGSIVSRKRPYLGRGNGKKSNLVFKNIVAAYRSLHTAANRVRLSVRRVVRLMLSLRSLVLVAVLIAATVGVMGGNGPTSITDFSSEGQEVVGTLTNASSDVVASLNTTATATRTPDVSDNSPAAQQSDTSSSDLNQTRVVRWVHDYVNQERDERGLNRLRLDPSLVYISDDYAEYMASRGHFGHDDRNGKGFQYRYDEADYRCRAGQNDGDGVTYSGAENILYTYYEESIRMDDDSTDYYNTERELARGMVNSWMESPGHRKNIIKPVWDNQGIGIGVSETTTGTKVYAVQNFC
jgi:uncharacterized protein YkwD